MEFRFNLSELFREPIVEIGCSLIPPGFKGDKRALWDTQSKITQIVNAMGESSATAQGLSKPITTADRLRNSEHKLYFLVDQSANNGKGAVTGMLKTGEKGLYVFDREGQHYKVSPPCVLDFYIHESRQRSGYGRNLFEHMLQKQQIEPVQMAVDRPSDKLLGFLNKHYGLNTPVKQMNNYVVFDGFFPKPSETPRAIDTDKSYNSPAKKQSANGLQQGMIASPYGRYGARRPPCSMGQIIHNESAVIKRNQEPTGVRSEPITNAQGQYNVYNSNQLPAWQATQSVPNMSYAYSQNQQNFAPSQHQQGAQQQYAPPSSGDYVASQQQIGQALAQNPMAQCQNQNSQQVNYNYTLGQGDATNQSYKDRDEITSTAHHQMQSQNADQHQHLHEAQEMPQNQNVAPQVFSYQGQNYCFNPQTQQYQMIPDQYQQNVGASGAQQQDTTQSDRQEALYGQQTIPKQHREPLRPQNLDGTVKKLQQSASMPEHKAATSATYGKPNLPVMVHETASAPVTYQHQRQSTSTNPQGTFEFGNTIPATPQASQRVEFENYAPQQNQIAAQAAFQSQFYQANAQNPQIYQNVGVNRPENIDRPPQISHNVAESPIMPNVNQTMLQAPNQSSPYQMQNVQLASSRQPVTMNVPNTSFQQQEHNSMAGVPNPNQPGSQQMSNHPQGRSINNQNVGDTFGNQTEQEQVQNTQSNLAMAAGASEQHVVHQHQNFGQQLQNSINQTTMNVATEQQSQSTACRVFGQECDRFSQRTSNAGQESRHVRQGEEVDLSKGYPPQHHEKPQHAQNTTPKADRPQSLNIEHADDLERKNNQRNDAHAEMHEPLDEDIDSLDGDPAELEAIEQEIEKIDVASKGSKSPGLEAAGIVTPGRNTPGLTEQGYFDLKFYHNKLW